MAGEKSGRRWGLGSRLRLVLSYSALQDMDSSGRFGTSLDEAAWLAGMQGGDDSAVAACVRTYCGRMLVVARRIRGNEEDAEDAVADANATHPGRRTERMDLLELSAAAD
jgi:hypothetical protein